MLIDIISLSALRSRQNIRRDRGAKMKAPVIYLAVLTLSSGVSSCSTQTEFEPLSQFFVDKEFITVSGISAGGAFATQV